MSRAVLPSTAIAEMIEGMGELDAAARHPGMVGSRDAQRRISRELLARLVDPPPGAADDPGEDQRLRFRAAFGQALLDEELIGPRLLGWH